MSTLSTADLEKKIDKDDLKKIIIEQSTTEDLILGQLLCVPQSEAELDWMAYNSIGKTINK